MPLSQRYPVKIGKETHTYPRRECRNDKVRSGDEHVEVFVVEVAVERDHEGQLPRDFYISGPDDFKVEWRDRRRSIREE